MDHEGRGKRLGTWKEIGAFLGRDERTAKRWEKERGLPVYRVPGAGRASVFAYTGELMSWLHQDDAAPPAVPVEPTPDPPPLIHPPPRAPARWTTHHVRHTAAALAIVVSVGVVMLLLRHRAEAVSAHSHEPSAVVEDLYLKGLYFWHERTPESLNRAVDLFSQAIARDPSYAEAYVGLANCYNLLREYTAMPDAVAWPRAMSAARHAIALDDSLSGAHSSLAFGEFFWEWRPEAAEREYRRAIELDPRSVPAHHWYATSLMTMGRFGEALDQIETARRLDPGSRAVLADKAYILYLTGRAEESIAVLKQVEAEDPAFLSPHAYLAYIYLIEGDYASYLDEAQRRAALQHDAHRQAISQQAARGFAAGGAKGMLTAMLAAQKKEFSSGGIDAYSLAQTSALAGDTRGALNYLRISLARHETSLVFAGIDRCFRSLRGDPAFRDVLARVHQVAA